MPTVSFLRPIQIETACEERGQSWSEVTLSTAQARWSPERDPNSLLYSVKSSEELHLRSQLLQTVRAIRFNSQFKTQETESPFALPEPQRTWPGRCRSSPVQELPRRWPCSGKRTSRAQSLRLSPGYALTLHTGNPWTDQHWDERLGQRLPETEAGALASCAVGAELSQHCLWRCWTCAQPNGPPSPLLPKPTSVVPKQTPVRIKSETVTSHGMEDRGLRIRIWSVK